MDKKNPSRQKIKQAILDVGLDPKLMAARFTEAGLSNHYEENYQKYMDVIVAVVQLKKKLEQAVQPLYITTPCPICGQARWYSVNFPNLDNYYGWKCAGAEPTGFEHNWAILWDAFKERMRNTKHPKSKPLQVHQVQLSTTFEVINEGEWMRLRCLNCGNMESITFPCSLDDYNLWMTVANARHTDCKKEKADGSR